MKRLGRPPHADILTPREWEVLELLREGLTNAQIARRLSITEGGVKFHVSSILDKLGVESRREAAEWRPGAVRRQWSFGGLFTVTVPNFSLPLTGKLIGAAGAAGLTIGLLGFAGASSRSLLPDMDLGAILVSQGGTNSAPSQMVATLTQRPEFGVFGQVPVATWSAAGELVDFHVLRPGFLPEGLRLDQIQMEYLPPREGHEISFPTIRNGFILSLFVSDTATSTFSRAGAWGRPRSRSRRTSPMVRSRPVSTRRSGYSMRPSSASAGGQTHGVPPAPAGCSPPTISRWRS